MQYKRSKIKVKNIGIIFILILIIFAGGCARTVTPLFNQGKTITFNVTYKDNLDTTANRYYIIMHCASSAQLPFDPKRFIEPGDIPSQPEINYQDFYNTWDHFFYLENNNIWLAKGPFVTTEAGTRESIAFWDNTNPKTLLINYDLNRLAMSSSIVYFDFVTVGVNDKIVKDNLSQGNNAVSVQNINTTFSGTFINGTDEATSPVPGSADILSWSVTVQ